MRWLHVAGRGTGVQRGGFVLASNENYQCRMSGKYYTPWRLYADRDDRAAPPPFCLKACTTSFWLLCQGCMITLEFCSASAQDANLTPLASPFLATLPLHATRCHEHLGRVVISPAQQHGAIRADCHRLDRVRVAAVLAHHLPRAQVPAAGDAVCTPSEHERLRGVPHQLRDGLRGARMYHSVKGCMTKQRGVAVVACAELLAYAG